MSPTNSFLVSCGHDKSCFREVSDDDHRNTFPCGACLTAIVGKRFSCSHCSFNLHPFCKTRPATLSSCLHPKHALSLVSAASSTSARVCDVCFEPVRGLFYTCHHRRCDFDVHPQCSQLSPWVRHALDPRHCLELKHRRPRTTLCNVCGGDCGGWGYRCGACSIDVHYWCLWKPAVAAGGTTTTTRSVHPDYPPRHYGFSGAPPPSQQPFYFGYSNYNGYGGGNMPPWLPGNNHGYHNSGGGSGIGSSMGAMNITGSLAVSLLSNLAANLLQNGFSF